MIDVELKVFGGKILSKKIILFKIVKKLSLSKKKLFFNLFIGIFKVMSLLIYIDVVE